MGSTQASQDVACNISSGYPKTASSKISMAESHMAEMAERVQRGQNSSPVKG